MKKQNDRNNNISYMIEEDEQEVLAYWTKERKANAIALLPEVETAKGEHMDHHELKAATDPLPADLDKNPFRTGGKLFYCCDGEDYVASAEIFMRKNILLTAAHCVQDRQTGHLWDHFLFERCYRYGVSKEQLTFKAFALKSYWYSKGGWRWDYALAILNRLSSVSSPLGFTLEDAVGKEVTLFGYPVNYFDGAQMVFVNGEAGKAERDGTREVQGNKMRGGCSGGAWVLKDNHTVVGLNSYGPISTKYAYTGSPVLDENFESLYEYVLSLM